MRTIRTVFPILLILAFGTALLAAPAGAQDRPMKLKITAEQANLREKPDIGSSIVQQIPEGVVVEADRKDGEWYFVRYTLEDGGVIGGWIHESLVEAVEAGTIARAERQQEQEPAAAPARRRGRPIRIGKIETPELRHRRHPAGVRVLRRIRLGRAPGPQRRGHADIADCHRRRSRPRGPARRRRPALRPTCSASS
ncbi:MAG: SH3 domain-containing protein [Candidatus Moduliflexus flocculans]|nr:SH3 domain-containing protein [Candidatus Moduliflexus flocculans]